MKKKILIFVFIIISLFLFANNGVFDKIALNGNWLTDAETGDTIATVEWTRDTLGNYVLTAYLTANYYTKIVTIDSIESKIQQCLDTAKLGVLDTTGTPVTNQLAIFTAANKLKGEDSLTWINGTLGVTGKVNIGSSDDTIIIDTNYRQYNNGSLLIKLDDKGYYNALNSDYNVGIGYYPFYYSSSGTDNIGIGKSVLQYNSGDDNIAVGSNALDAGLTGSNNVGIGTAVMSALTSGSENTCVGYSSMIFATTASNNTAIGRWSLYNNTGSNNIALGYYSGVYNTTQSNRIYINSLTRTNILGDTTLSPIYVFQAATTADQQLYLNANVNISDDLTVSGLTTGRLLYNTSGTLTTSQELTFDGSNFYAGGVAGITNFAVYPDYFAASSNVSSQISTNDGGLGGNITITSAGIEIQADDAPIVTDIDHLKYSIKNGADTLVKIYPDSAVFFKNFIIKGNFILDGTIEHHRYENAMFTHPDSTVTTSATTTWQFIGDGQNNKFTHIISNDFSFNGDTLQFDQDASDLRDSIKFRIHYSCTNAASSVNETIYTGIFVKHTGGEYIEIPQLTSTSTTSTAGIYYPGPVCTAMPIWLQDGDNIQIRIKIESGTSTLSTKNFKIYMYEK